MDKRKGTVKFVDVPCHLNERGECIREGTPTGTLWAHDPSTRKWWMLKPCRKCGGTHKPFGVREDRM